MSKRTHRTCIRMSAAEYQQLMKKSNSAGLSANAWLMEQLAQNRPILNRREDLQNLIRLPVTTYFRKPIAGSEIYERPGKEMSQLHAELNMIYSNIRQILRNPQAKALDLETAGKMGFLLEKAVEQTSHICAHHDLDWKGEWYPPSFAPCRPVWPLSGRGSVPARCAVWSRHRRRVAPIGFCEFAKPEQKNTIPRRTSCSKKQPSPSTRTIFPWNGYRSPADGKSGWYPYFPVRESVPPWIN